MGAVTESVRTYNTVIRPDFLEEDVYPDGYPGLVIIHRQHCEVVNPHWHQGLEVVHVISGGGQFTVDGRNRLLLKEDSLLISPYQLHRATTADPGHGPMHVVSVTFNHEVVSRIYPFADRYLFSLDSERAEQDDRERLDDLMLEIGRLYEKQDTASGFLLNASLYQLLHLVYTRFIVGVRKPESVRSGRNVVMQILGYLETHHMENLGESEVAAYFGYSREHFSRLFKKATGQTFKNFLTKLRLEDALNRLGRSSDSISSIALDTGFPSPISFITAFEQEYGMKPKQFRMNLHLVTGEDQG